MSGISSESALRDYGVVIASAQTMPAGNARFTVDKAATRALRLSRAATT